MRYFWHFLTLAALCLAPIASRAQDAKTPPLKFTFVRIGFNAYEPNRHYHKSGMWAPVQVGLAVGPDRIEDAKMMLEINDNEDTPSITTVPVPLLEANETRTVRSYVLPGNMSSDMKVTIKTRDKSFDKEDAYSERRIEPSKQLFLTLGGKFPDFHRALRQLRVAELNAAVEKKGPQQAVEGKDKEDGDELPENSDTGYRFAAYETDASALPDKYWGYQAVDLIIMSTENKEFVNALMQNDVSRLRALAQWIRRGGHMVVSVHWNSQPETANLFKHPAWQPPIPVQLSSTHDPARDPKRLQNVEYFAGLNNKPFENNKEKIPIAQLRPKHAPPADWTVRADLVEKDSDPLPIIARMPYGYGSITFLAFSVDPGSPFSKWDGRTDFWKSLIRNLVPDAQRADAAQGQFNRGDLSQDLITKMHKELDVFDVRIVPFGWVALFILIYIVIVGPVDYLVLKYVFKRLEWTWISFPIVVFAVSLAAYFTAYAIKGKELRVNQVDLVDIDMRTDVGEDGRPKKAYIYGQSFFALLSPRIQNYTIGVEPNARFWGQTDLKDPLSADMVCWLGKGGREFGGVEGRGSQSYFRRAYYINDPTDQAVGLVGVPISVWASKAFTASWEAALPKLPLQVELNYHQERGSETLVSGSLRNNLPVDLEDVWMFYNDQIYGVADMIEKGKTVKVTVPMPQQSKTKKANTWVTWPDECDEIARTPPDRGVVYNPTTIVKQTYVFDKAQSPTSNETDQFLRRLDQCWRLQDENKTDRDTRLHEAILYARVRFRSGSARAMCADEQQPLPTRVWLGKLPGDNLTQPEPTGHLNHDTYVRILVPVPPRQH